ncbi:MAG: NADH-quinone oxidoreductase subunit G, partial [Actinomycetota bacterium]|nr:NADH-quinone oxidoreductase subunit G [Actinomycetota bacterium]
LPASPGRDTSAMLAAAAGGRLGGLLVAGVDPADLPDPATAVAALDAARFVVSLEVRCSEVTERADVVFPVSAPVEKAGTYLDWEGRERPFSVALRDTTAVADYRVLHMLADEMDVALRLPDLTAVRRELTELGGWDGARVAPPAVPAATMPQPGPGQAVLATWQHLLDLGRLQDGEPYLAGTAKAPVARLSAATAAELGLADGAAVTVATERGDITLPLVVTSMPDRVVWLPTNSAGSAVRRTLGADNGSLVTVAKAAL